MADTYHASAINLADAGVNYAINQINEGSNSNTFSGSLPSGNFTVTVTLQDGVTPWNTSSNTMYIWSTGTVNGISRTVRVGAMKSGSGAVTDPLELETVIPLTTAPSSTAAKLKLTSMRGFDPNTYRPWRVRNTNPYDITFVWNLYGTTHSGTLVAKANSDLFFSTATLYNVSDPPEGPSTHPNTMTIKVSGVQHDVKASNPNGSTLPQEVQDELNGGGGGGFDFDKTWVEVNPRM
jgi:hypothetical protein